MGNICRLFIVFGVLSLILVVSAESSAQQGCGQMATCAQGQYGPGGCYRPHRQDCHGGVICSKSMRFCPTGGNGSGGCYLPSTSTCSNGLICPTGMQVCNAGPNGPGGCFRLNYAQCFDGLICEPGMKPCNDAQGPRCVRIGSNLCNRPASACPAGMRECKPGPYGPGGCFRLNYARCFDGLICETGMKPCNDAQGLRCVRIGSNLCNRPAQACPTGMRECQAGPNGPGGCFKVNYASCFSGLICSSGMRVCKDSKGTRCYNPAYSRCGSSATQRPYSPAPRSTPAPRPIPAPRSTPLPSSGWSVVQ